MFRAVFILGVVACGDNNVPDSRIAGQIWADDNGNGVRDPGEPGVANVLVYVDVDADPSINAADPYTRTDDTGIYDLIVPGPGSYQVHVDLPFGQRFATDQKRAPIIGGSDAGASDYGFMVALAFRSGSSVFQFCGGTLITDRHVVTAAHCSAGIGIDEVAVVGGTLDWASGGQVIGVDKITMHPKFTFDAAEGHDIAVWTLAEPMTFDGMTTIDLLGDDTSALAAAGTLATTVGWGVSDRASPLLQHVHVPIVAETACAEVYPTATSFDTQICAGALEGGVDSCQGDSGGPLLVRDPARQVWMQAGITSYGDGCALPDTPGVYSRVSALSAWAKEQAIEPGSTLRVTVAEVGDTATADIPTRSTTRPQIGAIAPRWQLTGIGLPDALDPDTAVTARWSILTDTPALDGFTCAFSPDLAGGAPAQPVACGLGTTELPLAGFSTGIFATELTVTRDDLTFTRRFNVTAGSPSRVDVAGSLAAGDPYDPDYSFGNYHVDYYDLTGLTGTRVFALDAISTGFSMFLTLYDLDERNFATGGGILDISAEHIVVVPEPGRRYAIGVSSFEEDATGDYVVSVFNDGALSPH